MGIIEGVTGGYASMVRKQGDLVVKLGIKRSLVMVHTDFPNINLRPFKAFFKQI